MSWELSKWNAHFTPDTVENIPMSKEEIWKAVQFLRDHYYPKPQDCPGRDCPKLRPACQVGICQIAVGMCGDF